MSADCFDRIGDWIESMIDDYRTPLRQSDYALVNG